MLNLNKSIKTLEFDKILNMLSALALTPGAKKKALCLLPSSNIILVKKRQEYTKNAKHMTEIKGAPSFGTMPEILDSVEKAEKNSILSPREILDIASVLRTTRGLLEYIRSDALEKCELTTFFDVLVPNKDLENRIFRAIISEDMIADEASPTLADIRRKIRFQTNKIREVLQSFLTGESSKYLRESIVTVRNGRYVIPVKSENKNEIKGLIHDSSGTGATLFIEPMGVVDANNELRTLIGQEQTEIERILAEFSSNISDFALQLTNNYTNITEIAFYFACAELSYKMNATEPIINNNKFISINKARHPLLDKQKVVPIDIQLGSNFNMLVVTGPNTGGKTVTLKTVGLFALMLQSGLQIPAETADMCIFDGVFADIGDEQSIEQSLSTFSGHMISVVNILNEITDNSLVLFDELGAGTDPIEGAALAQSILENVLAKNALSIATTHYAELKAFALTKEGVSNASCEFNVNTLKPTYRLIIGAPGKSNAFLISQKLGLPENVVNRAIELTTDESKNFEFVIGKLEESRIEMEVELAEIKRQKIEFEKFKENSERELTEKLSKAEQESEDMIQRAQQMISGAKASAEFIFEKLDKLQKDQSNYANKKKEIRQNILEADDVYNPVDIIDDNYVLPRSLKKGDFVVLKNIGTEGVLMEDPDKNGNVLIKSGIAHTKTNIKNLILISEEKKSQSQKIQRKESKAIVSSNFSISLDVRGKNIEEAWIDVDKYLDEAILHGIKSVTIVHGKGTGLLRKGLWEFFRKDKRIKKYRNGEYGEGDFGVTIIELK